MRLPCRHIFRLRKNSGVSLYDQNLCDERWTNTYYRSKHKSLRNSNKINNDQLENLNDLDENHFAVDISTQVRSTRLNSHKKCSKALDICKKIANTISQSSEDDFERKLGQLKSLNEAWCDGKEVGIQIFQKLSDVGVSSDVEPTVLQSAHVDVPVSSSKFRLISIHPVLHHPGFSNHLWRLCH